VAQRPDSSPRPKLPRSLRRSADRPAVPRGHPPQRLLDAAEVGLVTRRNTKPATVGRQAADRATFLRRKAARPGLSAREALGHRVAGTRPRIASFYAANPPRFVVVEGPLSVRDVQRAGQYMGSVGALLDAHRRGGSEWSQVSRAFERRFRRYAPIAGLALLADADAVIALAEVQRAGEQEVIFDSGRSRPGRRRRTAAAPKPAASKAAKAKPAMAKPASTKPAARPPKPAMAKPAMTKPAASQLFSGVGDLVDAALDLPADSAEQIERQLAAAQAEVTRLAALLKSKRAR
jgi:hypothetical protein